MSAENAWRIAMEAMREQWRLSPDAFKVNLASLPMPPAFRAAVEAEAEELQKGLSMASCDVWAERRRQIEAEGWTAEHDDSHDGGELARAAACYALIGGSRDRGLWRGESPNFWPWDLKWWKPKDRRADLVRAAALLIAEIERLDRALLSRLEAKGESHE